MNTKENVEKLRHIVIIALASDDELIETLVLKGGNAIDFISSKTGIVSRTSFDIDFSIAGDFEEQKEEIVSRIEKTLIQTFSENGYYLFDFRFQDKPSQLKEEVKDFWGGYYIEFKVVPLDVYKKHDGDIDILRRVAMPIHASGSPKFEIEISKYEYVEDKMQTELDGYKFSIYSPKMIAFEKLRAICQQLEAYRAIVPTNRRPRPKDLYDIHLILEEHKIDPSHSDCRTLLQKIFDAKKVPVDFIKQIRNDKDFHRSGWDDVVNTVSAKDDLKDFDFYFSYVLDKFEGITFP